MRVSTIYRPAGARFLTVHPELTAVSGSASAGVVLSVIDGWCRTAIASGYDGPLEDLWVRLSYRDIVDSACHLIGRTAIDTAVEKLIGLDLLERRQLEGQADRAFHWRLNLKLLNQQIQALESADARARFGMGGATESANVARASQGVNNKNEVTMQRAREIRADVQEAWALYLRLIATGPRKPELNDRRIKDLERAIDVTDLDRVKRAIVGLSRSPHHNGQNSTGQTYLDIRYAIKGNHNSGETSEERVERMAQLASSPGAVTAAPTTRDRGVLQGRIDSDKNVIRRIADRHGRPMTDNERRELGEAEKRLLSDGIRTEYREPDGWPIFTDIEVSS